MQVTTIPAALHQHCKIMNFTLLLYLNIVKTIYLNISIFVELFLQCLAAHTNCSNIMVFKEAIKNNQNNTKDEVYPSYCTC